METWKLTSRRDALLGAKAPPHLSTQPTAMPTWVLSSAAPETQRWVRTPSDEENNSLVLGNVHRLPEACGLHCEYAAHRRISRLCDYAVMSCLR
ncbi:hypothetical protein TSMEX_003793 [Taenia solium]